MNFPSWQARAARWKRVSTSKLAAPVRGLSSAGVMRGVVPETGIEPVRPRGRGIFLPLRLSPPAQACCSWSGARLHHSLAGLRCPPSALYTFPGWPPGLGSALARTGSRAFTEFDGLHLWSFLQRAQICSSPLCLPISPLGRCAVRVGPAAGETIPSRPHGRARGGELLPRPRARRRIVAAAARG